MGERVAGLPGENLGNELSDLQEGISRWQESFSRKFHAPLAGKLYRAVAVAGVNAAFSQTEETGDTVKQRRRAKSWLIGFNRGVNYDGERTEDAIVERLADSPLNPFQQVAFIVGLEVRLRLEPEEAAPAVDLLPDAATDIFDSELLDEKSPTARALGMLSKCLQAIKLVESGECGTPG